MNLLPDLLPDIRDQFNSIGSLFKKEDLIEILDHDSMKVYFNIGISDKGFSISELPTTSARAAILFPIIRKQIEDTGNNISVLDLACSPGYFMFKTAALGIESITGVDARPVHFKQHNFLNSYYKYKTRFVLSDIHDFLQQEIKQGSQYDLCFLFGFLYHTPTPVELLRDINKICRKCLIIDTTLSFGFGSSLNIYEEPTLWSRASTTRISLMPSLKAIPKLIEAAGYRKAERIIPPATLRKMNPGGDNIDYFFDRTILGSGLSSYVKRFIKGTLNILHFKVGAPRAIFAAYK